MRLARPLGMTCHQLVGIKAAISSRVPEDMSQIARRPRASPIQPPFPEWSTAGGTAPFDIKDAGDVEETHLWS